MSSHMLIPGRRTSRVLLPTSFKMGAYYRPPSQRSSVASSLTSAMAVAASTIPLPRWRFRKDVLPTISSDIHVFSGNTPGMPYLPWVMSIFHGIGLYTRASRGHGDHQPGEG